jgi:hypothetical protein
MLWEHVAWHLSATLYERVAIYSVVGIWGGGGGAVDVAAAAGRGV